MNHKLTMLPITDTEVDSISPDNGLEVGGTSITLTGSGFSTSFTANPSCLFEPGNQLTSATVQSDTLANCTTPAGSGFTQVFLTFNDQTGFSSSGFEFVTPILDMANPSVASADSSRLITLTGSGFRDKSELMCRFGVVNVTATFRSETSIECESPTGLDLGILDLQVTNNGIEYSNPITFRCTSLSSVLINNQSTSYSLRYPHCLHSWRPGIS